MRRSEGDDLAVLGITGLYRVQPPGQVMEKHGRKADEQHAAELGVRSHTGQGGNDPFGRRQARCRRRHGSSAIRGSFLAAIGGRHASGEQVVVIGGPAP